MSKFKLSSGSSRLLITALVCTCCCASISTFKTIEASEIELAPQEQNQSTNNIIDQVDSSSRSLPANHRVDNDDEPSIKSKKTGRQSRQYDGSLGTSGTGNFASISSGDGAAYVAQMPLAGSGYASSSGGGVASNYGGTTGDISSPYHSSPYHDPLSMVRGYPSQPFSPMHHQAGYPSPIGPSISSMFSSGGPLSSSMFPLMTKGFDVSEIVCTAIAVAIGAVIVGAPFILIYLFVMNQMNGNGQNMGPSGGAISLTGPTSSTTVSGRKKRHTSLPEALMKQLSPLVNSEQVANTFKMLMNSIAKYQV